jgi:hypothetical protein
MTKRRGAADIRKLVRPVESLLYLQTSAEGTDSDCTLSLQSAHGTLAGWPLAWLAGGVCSELTGARSEQMPPPGRGNCGPCRSPRGNHTQQPYLEATIHPYHIQASSIPTH